MTGLAERNEDIKELLSQKKLSFWSLLQERTRKADDYADLHYLSVLRRKAIAAGMKCETTNSARIAIIGGFTFYPLNELIEHVLLTEGIAAQIFTGEFDNFIAEIKDPASELHSFEPDYVLFVPPAHRYSYSGHLSDSRESIDNELQQKTDEITDLCRSINQATGANVILTTLLPSSGFDPGAFRNRSLASEWSFLRQLNINLGLTAESYVNILDIEFLAYRRGALEVEDDRSWFESKQPWSLNFSCDVAKEFAHLVNSLRQPTKKVLALDLDGTIWGGILADDGIEALELGTTSPRGESFREFQKFLLRLHDRGILLAVCSKNDHETALEVFRSHPEMILKPHHIVSFKANWEPKPNNIQAIADELNLSLDSFVFVDDSPGEVELMRQSAPQVATILLADDPSAFVKQLENCRYFEPIQLTSEDTERTMQYQNDKTRKQMLVTASTLEAYLESLNMVADVQNFREIDIPRITQLINKSNQYNLTTKRRTEADVRQLMNSDSIAFSVRLMDRLGDLGIISVLIATPEQDSETLSIDTWLMSCRVLGRQVEHFVLNELMERAQNRAIKTVSGEYIASPKNQMVKEHFDKMRFALVKETESVKQYALKTDGFEPFATNIERRPN